MMVTDWNRMTRWVLLVIFLAISGGVCVAESVDRDTALVAAISFLSSGDDRLRHPMSADLGIIDEPRPVQDPVTGDILAYVLALAPTGYVVLGPDTRLPPIIAHSDESVFQWDEGPSNVLLNLLRADLAARLEALYDRAIPTDYERDAEAEWSALRSGISPQASTKSSEIIGPLIEATTWTQSSPWNDYVPVDPTTGSKSLAGCVATALAQLVNYWQYPESIAFTRESDYATMTRHIGISATTASIPWIEFPARSYYNPSDEMMAKLSYAAGVSVQMDYASFGSGAYLIDMAYALAGGPTPVQRYVQPAVWGYETAEIRTYVMQGWGSPFVQSQTEFYHALKRDLEEGAPVVLNVTTSSTSAGHALICDGYDRVTGRYHLNLGWGGQSDGWYDLPEDIPSGYNVVEYGILNIRPPADRAESFAEGQGNPPVAEAIDAVVHATPLPLRTETRFVYTGETPAIFTVRIFSIDGQLVWEQSTVEHAEIVWDGRSTDGSRMANAPYIYVASGLKDTTAFRRRGIIFIQR